MSHTPLRQTLQSPPSPSRSSDDERAQGTSNGEELASLTPILPKPYPRSSTATRYLHRMEWDKENYDPHAQSFSNDPPFTSHSSGSTSKSPLSDITRTQIRVHTPSSLQSSHVYTQDSDLLLQKTSFSFSIYDESSSLSFPHLVDEPSSSTFPRSVIDISQRDEAATMPSEIDACSYVQISEQDSLLSSDPHITIVSTLDSMSHPHPSSSKNERERGQEHEHEGESEKKKGKPFTFFR